MLTKGAVGNLVNRYRAVLKKCHLLNVFGSLAVAGMLVMGGATAAAATTWGPGNDVVISGEETKNDSGQAKSLTISGSGNSFGYTGVSGGGADQLFISEKLTIANGGALTVKPMDHAGIQGAANHDTLVDSGYTATLDMSGATSQLTIQSQMQMKNVNISGGTVSISGTAVNGSNAWTEGAMLGAVGGTFSLNGGTVTLSDNAQLFAPVFNLDGGVLNIQGATGKKNVVRAYGDNGSLNLNGANITVEGDGVLSAENMNITGGALTVNQGKNLTVGVRLNPQDTTLSTAIQKAEEATITQTGGKVNVAGRMDLGGELNIEGGEFTVANSGEVRVMEGSGYGKNSAINMQGGTLNVNGYAEAAQLSITGGTTNIIGDPSKTWDQQGLGGYNETWDAAANKWADAGKPTTISGPNTVVNIENANLFGGIADIGANGGILVANGATVNLSGDTAEKAGMLYASNGQELTIDTGASVNVADGEYGVFNAAAVNISDGATVSVGGELLAAQLTKGNTIANLKPTAQSSAVTVGDGGTLQVTGTGSVDLNGKSTLDFKEGSTFDVSAASASNGNAPIKNAPSSGVTVADGAKLRITDAMAGDTYTLIQGAADALDRQGAGWTGDNFLTDSSMLDIVMNSDGTFGVKTADVSKALPNMDVELASLVSRMYADRRNDVDAREPGRRFLSRATNNRYMSDRHEGVVAVEGAARMAVVGAVPQMTMAASNAAGAAVTQRTSLARPGGDSMRSVALDGSAQTGLAAGDAAKTGLGLWIMPLYQSSNGWGMKAGDFNLSYSGALGGVALGADYTFDNAIRAGIAFNIGGGYGEGSGDFNKTTNDMNFWGLGAYLGWTRNNIGLAADLNYTSTYSELEQELPSGMRMRDLKSDVTAYAISAGLRGEYKIETGILDLIPHVGVRYMSLNTNEYDVKSEGKLLKGDGITQSIWTFPVGVTLSKEIKTDSGWIFRPSLDLAVISAAGDIEARGDVRFTGVPGTAEVKTQTMDYVTYMGQAGLEFGNDNVKLGVNYNLQAGAHSTSHGVFGTFRYEF